MTLRMHVVTLCTVLIVACGCAVDPSEHRIAPAVRILADDTRHHSGNARNTSRDVVARIAIRIIQAAQHSEYGGRAASLNWELSIHEDDAIASVYARPGGRIVLYSGIYRIAETEAGLAAILSHEVAHTLAHQDKLATPQTEANTAVLFSREEEIEADRIGLNLMAKAGYDPREMLQVWNRLKSSDENFSRAPVLSHVLYDRRMERIVEWLPEALVLYERSRRAPQRALPRP